MEIVLPPLKIVKHPHPSLKHKAVALKEISPRLVRIAEEMLALMYEAKGLGLAAPQVGLPFRMFVCNYSGDPQQKELEAVYINPRVDNPKGSIEAEEGCLSFPGLYKNVRRAKSVLGQAYNLKGELLALEVVGLAARIWQHETDHLDGKVFTEQMSDLGRLGSRADLAEFEHEYRLAQQKGEYPPDDEIKRRLGELEKLAEPQAH